MPAVGDAVAADGAELVWAPLAEPAAATAAEAAYLRHWAAPEVEEAALVALWKAGGDVSAAEAAMQAKQAAKSAEAGSGAKASLAEEASLGQLLTAAIIEHRKDLVRARRALANKGQSLSLNELQVCMHACLCPPRPTTPCSPRLTAPWGLRAAALLLRALAPLNGGRDALRGYGAGAGDG